MKTTEQKVLKFIDRLKLINENDKLLVAFSGGPDSVFALKFLLKYLSRLKITLGACHINHQLRGKDSDNDQLFCRIFCEENNVELHTASFDVTSFASDNSLSLEEAARKIRYEEFQKIAIEFGYTKIVTAHNMSDNSETVLFNLFKGTGIKGLRGIPVQRENIIRPFLCLSKDEIVNYLKLTDSDFCLDKSNDDQKFKRNFLRNEIIPKIKEEINPNFDEAVLRNSEILSNSIEIVNSLAETEYQRLVDENDDSFSIKINRNISDELFSEVIRKAVDKHLDIEVTFSDIQHILSLSKGNAGSKLELKNNTVVINDRDKIVFVKKTVDETELVKLKIGDEVIFEGKKFFLEEVENHINNLKFSKEFELFSADNLTEFFILRRWKNGDRFIPLGMANFKSVSDFLTDQKVSSLKKREQLVLENDSKIVALLNCRIDNRVKITDITKRVYKLWTMKIS
ncbi:MAG: tRNA lysidine(34) synthetase TilS [Melioribacteraceae bacterium]|nr:tRNA lysidine(34) synthetase TilS [Melioribacteraceae bacterium]